MREFINKLTVTGELVKNNISDVTEDGQAKMKDNRECIGGSLILRTADNSEHEIGLFAYRYKKDENGKETGEETYFYKQYKAAMEYKDFEHCGEGERPDVISIDGGSFSVNDYLQKDSGNLVTINKLNGRFVSKVEAKDLDSTVREAKFELEGIIDKISDEIVKDAPTGNIIVSLNAIRQKAEGFGNNAKYSADSLIPVKLIVDKDMADAFRNAGYYEGCMTKFTGKCINNVETQDIVEKQVFGEDIHNIIKTYVRRNQIASGSDVKTIYDYDLTDDIVSTLVAQRKQKLAEVKSGVSKSNSTSVSQSDAPKTSANPFANPFAQ